MATRFSTIATLFVLLSIGGCKISRGHQEAVPKTILSFAELRQPIEMEEPKPIYENGKIILYGQYLIINEPNLGIHIIDNTTPEAPINLGFMRIPGSTDVVIQNDLLYVRSYIDLVTLDVSNMNNIKNKHRTKSVFAPLYDPAEYGIEPEDGVIIDIEWVFVANEVLFEKDKT